MLSAVTRALGALLLLAGAGGPARAADGAECAQDGPYVVVLGVAQDAGHPQAGCDRACCAAAWAGAGHAVVSLGIVDPATGQHWLLDASPDLPAQEHALPGALAGVLLTHAHMGHYTGLLHLGREAMGARSVPVWAMPRMAALLRNEAPWSQLVALDNIALRALSAGTPVALAPGLRVTPLLVPHRDELSETVGFVVEGPGRAVLYLPDIDKWERWDTPVEQWIARVDVALLDGTFYDGAELPGRDMSEIPHPFIVESLARFAPLPAAQRDRVRFLHLNHSNPLLQPAGPAREAVEAAGLHVAAEGERHPLSAPCSPGAAH